MLNWEELMPHGAPGSALPGHVENPEKPPVNDADECTSSDGENTTPGQDLHKKEAKTVSNCSFVPACPGSFGGLSRQLVHDNTMYNNDKKAFVPVVPVVPAKNQRVSCSTPENSAHGGGVAGKNLAPENEQANAVHPINPAAVALVVAACEQTRKTPEEIGRHILALHAMAPGEQVRQWSKHCQAIGLFPWRILAMDSPGEGKDCGMCGNLHSVFDHVEGDSQPRRRFRWACKLGYLILEYGRATERIMLAPPECTRWERFYPGPWR